MALEPNCPLEEAVRKAEAAGLPAQASLDVRYEVSDRYKKPVWKLSPSGAPGGKGHTLDGVTCAILIR